jgi:hypothetical protein
MQHEGERWFTHEQVLKLKSLLSRAEIEKRSLQQQLDLKVHAGFTESRIGSKWLALVIADANHRNSLVCNRLLKTRILPAFATNYCLEWKRANVLQVKVCLEMRRYESVA